VTFDPLPVGEIVPLSASTEQPTCQTISGDYVMLVPTNADADAEALFAASHGDEDRVRLWTYMLNGPFADVAAMREWLRGCERSTDPLFFTVTDLASTQRIGMVSYLNIVPVMRRLELGNIWYTPQVQRTKVNTETIYLMLCETFDRLHYRRAEWKCDALNARSRAAALRLGFNFEGIFRQHMIVRNRNRDTAWFAMTDEEWPAIKANMERWLYGTEASLSLRSLNADLSRPSVVEIG
jgi:RimJ/RimL family protein N-acetyltransferase